MRVFLPTVEQWGWSCGFYPGLEPGEYQDGSAPTFDAARAAFEAAWRRLLSQLTDADFGEYRRHRVRESWKRAMWDAGRMLPTQVADGRSRCFRGAEIKITGFEQHVAAAHMMFKEPAA